jgi:hypothetical protein
MKVDQWCGSRSIDGEGMKSPLVHFQCAIAQGDPYVAPSQRGRPRKPTFVIAELLKLWKLEGGKMRKVQDNTDLPHNHIFYILARIIFQPERPERPVTAI